MLEYIMGEKCRTGKSMSKSEMENAVVENAAHNIWKAVRKVSCGAARRMHRTGSMRASAFLHI